MNDRDEMGTNDHDNERDTEDHDGRDERAALRSLARTIVGGLSLRTALLGPEISAEPVWDVLLRLFVAEQDDRHTQLGRIGLGSPMSPATAERCINHLLETGMITRAADPHDLRITYAALTETATREITAYMKALRTICRDEPTFPTP